MKLNMYIVYLPAVLFLINTPQRNENTDLFKTLPLGQKSGLRSEERLLLQSTQG